MSTQAAGKAFTAKEQERQRKLCNVAKLLDNYDKFLSMQDGNWMLAMKEDDDYPVEGDIANLLYVTRGTLVSLAVGNLLNILIDLLHDLDIADWRRSITIYWRGQAWMYERFAEVSLYKLVRNVPSTIDLTIGKDIQDIVDATERAQMHADL